MANTPIAAIPAIIWLPTAKAFAPLDGWKVAGEVDEVPAVVVGDPVPAADPLAAGVVVLPTG